MCAAQQGIQGAQILHSEFDSPGVGGGGVLFLNHVLDVDSSSLTCTVEEVLASLDDLSAGRQGAILSGRSDLIDAHGRGANGVDVDLGNDQVSVE